ncbi:hypothetical protein [Marinobacter oulmenensis]|uniref:WD40 repeat protein n=1 Tax=Marinobacter oulmenensis TaxID=643747 RepID=A0A840UBF3_9GAMM|nr:hypothetical protein [Marinobacter oulmenensis]MBB5322342.1 WD40 repeat protein [Marinobacter oulmenensis]
MTETNLFVFGEKSFDRWRAFYVDEQGQGDIIPPPDVIDGWVYDISFAPDQTLMAVAANSGIKVLNTSDFSLVAGAPTSGTAHGCHFSPDGQFLAVAYRYSPYFEVYSTSDWSVVTSKSEGSWVHSCHFSPDSSMVAIGRENSPYIKVFSTTDWSLSASPSPANGEQQTRCVRFSSGGQWLATGHVDGRRLNVFDTSDWSSLSVPSLPGGGYNAGYGLEFSADDSKLAAAHGASGDSEGFQVIDTATWTLDAGVPDFSNCRSVSISDDGIYYAVGSDTSPYLKIYDSRDWSEIPGFDTNLANSGVWAVRFAPQSVTKKQATVEVKAFDGSAYAGAQISLRKDNGGLVLTGTTDQSGTVGIASPLVPNRLWATVIGATTDAAKVIYPTAAVDTVYLPYDGERVTISSNLTTQSGAPGDEVVIRNWTTRELVVKVVPDANGDWSAQVPPGTYDVSYIAENCAPVIHGPYTVELP